MLSPVMGVLEVVMRLYDRVGSVRSVEIERAGAQEIKNAPIFRRYSARV